MEHQVRNAIKTILFVSAFSPALISVGFARIVSGGLFWDSIYYLVSGLIGSFTVLFILSELNWRGESFSFNARKIESNDALLLGIVASYIFPFFGRAADITIGTVAILLTSLFVVFWFTDASLPSPLLRLMGYRFYKAEASNGMVYTLITDREILDPSNVKMVKKITGSMLLEVTR
jgi:hypothetical protein